MTPLEQLARDLLNPEQYGFAVSSEVRDAARMALGRNPIETKSYTAPQHSVDQQGTILMDQQISRLRIIERAAWHALELAHQNRSADAYDTLANALEVKTCALG